MVESKLSAQTVQSIEGHATRTRINKQIKNHQNSPINLTRGMNESTIDEKNDRKISDGISEDILKMDEKKVLNQLRWKRKNLLSHRHRQGQFMLSLLLGLISVALVSDLSRLINHLQLRPAQNSNEQQLKPLAAWASWIGEVPTAAELYGEAASEMPSTESFEDDDEDEELDASASNEYPDNENENENDESYDDPEEGEQESRRSEFWLPAATPSTLGGYVRTTRRPVSSKEAVWADLEGRGWHRNKRDLEDPIMLGSRRANLQKRHTAGPGGEASELGAQRDEDFAVDDGDEDAWVHDGIDDIHIDPETKRAASEHSRDEKSIDSEYDPHQRQESNIINKTRITTIAEVIPMSVDPFDNEEAPSSTTSTSARLSGRFVSDNQKQQATVKPPASQAQMIFMPAAHLSIEQAQRLVEQQAAPIFWGSESAPSLSAVLPTPRPPPLTPVKGASSSQEKQQRHLASEDSNFWPSTQAKDTTRGR